MLHQRGANQEAVSKVAEIADLGVGMNPGFADHGDVMAQARCQLAGAVEVNRHIAQIAVVDPDHLRLQRNGAFQLFFGTHFGQPRPY
ncbi:Uncharacterised protein [Raoultella terrigena]|uniref:Uncharacterized protein n=1 Tax=Raoultella terrigena TaxID=577 RepID=A0A4U9CYZ4_RAOTE|nr:Uncharacterised protein [Raoultella terrigena]